jgi:serine/threonine protein kinase
MTFQNRSDLPDYIEIKDCGKIEFNTIFTAASSALIHLISSCLHLNPNKRCTATQALKSTYFQEEPYACDDSELPIPGSAGDGIMAKKRRLGNETDAIIGRRLNF